MRTDNYLKILLCLYTASLNQINLKTFHLGYWLTMISDRHYIIDSLSWICMNNFGLGALFNPCTNLVTQN